MAARGFEALALARRIRPIAISLDVFLPDMLGWAVLSQLKQDPQTRHIPVQIITLDEDRQHGLAGGAFSYCQQAHDHRQPEAFVARLTEYARTPQAAPGGGGQSTELLSITELLGHDDIEVVAVETGREA